MSARVRSILLRRAPPFGASQGTVPLNWRRLPERYTTRVFTTTINTETKDEHLIDLRSSFQRMGLDPKTHHLLTICHYEGKEMVNSAYNQLDVGIPISVPVEVFYIKKANADEMNPPVNPRITVGGIVLQEYLRRLYRSLPASYHEPDLLFNPFLTKAEIFNKLAKWCKPNMTRGIRTIHSPYNARSKILQLALAKPGYWDEATYGYGLERSFWYGRAGHAGGGSGFYLACSVTSGSLNGNVIVRLTDIPFFPHQPLATMGLLAKGGLVVFLVIVVWLFAKNWGIVSWQDLSIWPGIVQFNS